MGIAVSAEELQTVPHVLFQGKLQGIVVGKPAIGHLSTATVDGAIKREEFRVNRSQASASSDASRVCQAYGDVRRNDGIECIGGDQFAAVRADVPYSHDRLARQLTFYGQVVVKRMRGSKVLRDHAQVRTNLKLCKINVGSSWARCSVGKFIGDRKSASDIVKRIGKRRIVKICLTGGIRHSQRVQAKGSNPQVLQVELLFASIEVETEAAADGCLPAPTRQVSTPIRSVSKSRPRTDVVEFGTGASVRVAAGIARQGIPYWSSGKYFRLQARLDAHTR